MSQLIISITTHSTDYDLICRPFFYAMTPMGREDRQCTRIDLSVVCDRFNLLPLWLGTIKGHPDRQTIRSFYNDGTKRKLPPVHIAHRLLPFELNVRKALFLALKCLSVLIVNECK